MSDEDADRGHDQGGVRRSNTWWTIGTVVVMVAWLVFLFSLVEEDRGPICGTGQDKHPC
ncbi:hypothetical protein ACIGBL_24445 [Streptomyces sp. NPDC085614]|uniref:hypothetical protein n=1 Tax=unclassified Streptomyces TaxID=2593676 RepID=UPI00164F4D78|nr:hypothetical protein [Streptomyces sp. ms191]